MDGDRKDKSKVYRENPISYEEDIAQLRAMLEGALENIAVGGAIPHRVRVKGMASIIEHALQNMEGAAANAAESSPGVIDERVLQAPPGTDDPKLPLLEFARPEERLFLREILRRKGIEEGAVVDVNHVFRVLVDGFKDAYKKANEAEHTEPPEIYGRRIAEALLLSDIIERMLLPAKPFGMENFIDSFGGIDLPDQEVLLPLLEKHGLGDMPLAVELSLKNRFNDLLSYKEWLQEECPEVSENLDGFVREIAGMLDIASTYKVYEEELRAHHTQQRGR